MGAEVSIAAFNPSHVRIYRNILGIRNPHTRVQMIQTCLASPEYVMAAKQAGVYSYLLSYISSVTNGYQPRQLPGEATAASATMAPVTAQQQTAFPVPRSTAGMTSWAQTPVAMGAAIATGVGRPAPPQTRQDRSHAGVGRSAQQALPAADYAQAHALTHYQEEPQGPVWKQIAVTPKQKMVSYFASCLEVLGIQEEVAITEEALKKAYKRAALRAHPDKGGSEEHFEAVTRSYAYLSEILRRMNGGRGSGSGIGSGTAIGGAGSIEAPSVITTSRKEEAAAWQHAEPVKLNPKNLDMNAFNHLFEQTHMPDPDQDGYGDWLKDNVGGKAKGPKFSGKFNRDVFNSMFEEEARRGATAAGSSALVVHPEAMALGPTMGVEIGRDRPQDFTAAANSRQQFTDLRSAYTTESTITDKVANVRVEERRYDTYKASREKAPDPYTATERQQLAASEAELKAREDARQRRAAERGVMENDYFERMKRLVIMDKI